MSLQRDLSVAWEVFRKDLRLEVREKFQLTSMIVFSVSAVFVFALATGSSTFSNTNETDVRVVSASMWVIFVFAGMLSFGSIFGRELRTGGGLSVLRSFPVKPQSVFIGKLLFNILVLGVVEVVLLLIYTLFFQLSFGSSIGLVGLVLVVGTIDYAVVGTLVSALSVYSKAKTLTIPILTFPLIIPSVVLSANLLTDALLGNLTGIFNQDLVLLIAHFVFILVLSLLSIDTILSD